MRIAEHLATIDHDGQRLVEAARRAGLDAAVPTCPGWQVRDLLAHTGGVHRWAASFVATGRAEPYPPAEKAAFLTAPDDDELVDWYRGGHRSLVDALSAADESLSCWMFLAAPSPLAFWARRQAHETAIHRVDAEAALAVVSGTGPEVAVPPVVDRAGAGAAVLSAVDGADAGAAPSAAPRGSWGRAHLRQTPAPAAPARWDPAFAADGVDELLNGFFARPGGRLRADPPRRVTVRATDAGVAWTIHIGPAGCRVEDGRHPADLTVAGPSNDLYLWLWNRAGPEHLDVQGDGEVLKLWRERANVRWS